jgi:hypothetical protein
VKTRKTRRLGHPPRRRDGAYGSPGRPSGGRLSSGKSLAPHELRSRPPGAWPRAGGRHRLAVKPRLTRLLLVGWAPAARPMVSATACAARYAHASTAGAIALPAQRRPYLSARGEKTDVGLGARTRPPPICRASCAAHESAAGALDPQGSEQYFLNNDLC